MIVDLSIRIIQEGDEYQVIIEGDGVTRILKARSIDELTNSLTNEIRDLLSIKENTETLKSSACTLRGWYIRLPVMKLLDIVAFLTKNNQGDATENLLKYLDTHGLSRSNYRVIVPTLSALGLWKQGRLTREAEELGKAVIDGSQELPNLLYRIAIRNCMLRDVIDKLAEGYPMNDAIKLLGLTRRDEINYTINLLEIIMSGDEFKCLYYTKALGNYLRNGGCFTALDLPRGCTLNQVVAIFNYLMNNKGFHMMSLLNDVDVTVNLGSVTAQLYDDYALIIQGSKPVGALIGEVIITNSNYAPRAREAVDRLEPIATKITRLNNLAFSMIIVPIVIRDECPRVKAYVMVGNKMGDWIARVFDLP
ncbi:hypothetical protein [Vulcanisaeta souniana]|uniref:hypothetical protein n=1 Tax=Vulcanisaeta souniana TaxID=164452 RepID=UPI001E33F1A1|nr:hypothetical protein [Vulcanisaeta souniana]